MKLHKFLSEGNALPKLKLSGGHNFILDEVWYYFEYNNWKICVNKYKLY